MLSSIVNTLPRIGIAVRSARKEFDFHTPHSYRQAGIRIRTAIEPAAPTRSTCSCQLVSRRAGPQRHFRTRIAMPTRRSFLASSLVTGAALALPRAAAADDTVRDIGSRRELFIDRFLIDREKGTQLK